MIRLIQKLMVLTAMSFLFSGHAFSSDAEKEAKKMISATKREIHKHSVGLGLGQTFLLGNFENRGDDQITFDFLYAYTASYSFDLLVGVHSSHHKLKDESVNLQGYTMSIKARSYEFDAFSPFVLGGLGFYMPVIEEKDGEKSDPKYTFGFNFGAGADLRLNDKVIVGLLAHYHKPFEVKQDDTENVRGSYFKLLLTAMYLF